MPAPFGEQRKQLESMGIVLEGNTRAAPTEGQDPRQDPDTCVATLPPGWKQEHYGSGNSAIIDDKGVTRVTFTLIFGSGARADSPEGSIRINNPIF